MQIPVSAKVTLNQSRSKSAISSDKRAHIASGPGLDKFIADSLSNDEVVSSHGCNAGASGIESENYQGKLKSEGGER